MGFLIVLRGLFQEKKKQLNLSLSHGSFTFSFLRKLHDNNCGEHEYAAERLSKRKRFIKNRAAGKYGENRFEAKYDRRCCRFGVLLTDDLQSVSHAAAHNARIQNRHRA